VDRGQHARGLGPQARTVYIAECGGFDLHITTAGQSAPALLFMHYWGGSSRTSRPVIERFAPAHLCVAYDHRGWGRSGAPASGFAIGDLARDALAVITALGLDDYVLVGHSMAPAEPMDAGARQQLLGVYADPGSVRGAVEHVLTHRLPGEEVVEQIVADTLSGTAEATATWSLHAIAEDVSAGAESIDVPALVVAGEHDVVEPVALMAGHVVPSLPDARLEVVADSGHLIPLEKPRELAELIDAFVASL
jgi:pimeloyl-ACP methyl ester carboxylesterase